MIKRNIPHSVEILNHDIAQVNQFTSVIRIHKNRNHISNRQTAKLIVNYGKHSIQITNRNSSQIVKVQINYSLETHYSDICTLYKQFY